MSHAPWWLKIVAKLVLARLPVPASFWRELNLFRHGAMDDPGYALRVFRRHLARAGSLAPGWTCLELGPGDSLLTAVIAKAHGADRVFLVDVGNFASADITGHLSVAATLAAEGVRVPEIRKGMTVDDVLALCNASYLTDGLESLRRIPRGEVDFAFSNAVLEHVRAHEFAATMHELKLAMKPSGVQSHAIDLRDHLAASLNNLRFSPRLWETGIVARSGFYTNRLRHGDIIKVLQDCGYRVDEVHRTTWPELPLPREKMHPRFRRYGDDDLLVSDFEIELRYPG